MKKQKQIWISKWISSFTKPKKKKQPKKKTIKKKSLKIKDMLSIYDINNDFIKQNPTLYK
jgi:hypothetical protein